MTPTLFIVLGAALLLTVVLVLMGGRDKSKIS